MILHVEFDQFAETVRRMLETKEAFYRVHSNTVVITAGKPEKCFVVASTSRLGIPEIISKLQNEGFTLSEGEWTDAGESAADRVGDRQAYIAAVAYSSREKMPGLWVDAFPSQPVTGAVLRAFYDELASNGEIPEVGFEEFVRLSNPNVMIFSPSEIQGFLDKKENC